VKKQSKGITLVSLVVTIIILIILAGVSINAILGENGIITIAKQAKENMQKVQTDEQGQLNELYTQIEEEGRTSGGISYDTIVELEKQITTLEKEKSELETQVADLTAKQSTGTATAEQVLSGYTFSNSSSIGISGSMIDRGELNWNPTTETTYTLPAGYYSGGTLNSSGAYNAGVAAAQASSGIERIEVGKSNGISAHTFNIAAIDPNYASYTIENFGMSATYYYHSERGHPTTGTFSGAMTYNASTGVLTVPKNVYIEGADGSSAHYYYSMAYTVYLYRTKS